jgi:RNA polymerase sigma-70 factor (ECF subfamily)
MLPRRQREALVIHYYLGLDIRATARALGVTEGTIKTSLHRARAALAPLLAEGEAALPEVANDVQS